MLMMTTTTTKTMLIDRNKYAFVTIYCGLLCLSAVGATAVGNGNGVTEISEANIKSVQQQQDEVNAITEPTTVRNFSPRLEYNNEWRPLGHGDPLKNDPTYDYSPPALDRVRYWAENGSSGGDNKETKKQNVPLDVLRNKTKSEILLLGVSNERARGGPPQAQSHMLGNLLKNPRPPAGGSIKGIEAPVLQPKYTSIRRSYFAQQQQMPYTHLMPPPMHPVMPSAPSHHIMKHNSAPMQNEYRHSVMNMGSYMTPSSTVMHHRTVSQPISGMHTKPYYSTAVTAQWMHPSTSRNPPSNAYDTHHQESMQHYSFTRPAQAGNSIHITSQVPHSYSPNSIHMHSSSGHKQSLAPRKPWLHELLQKEITKPVKPTMPATKYLMGSTKPHYEIMKPAYGISSTYAPMSYTPITFVSGPPTIPTSSTTTTTTTTITPATLSTSYPQNAVYITPTPRTEIRTPPSAPSSSLGSSEAGFRPMLPSTTSTLPTPTYAPMPSSTTSNRLLIPTMSNLSNRPTIAPFEMTTDALFKHYKQPKKPLLGPMYLIIEGHSKVKTYGQNELDPHQPKIVPIIPKREPVIRIADPNEKRGTIETFQVKHLHTKSTTPMPSTTTTTTTTTTANPKTTTIQLTTTTTTPKPNDASMTDTSAQLQTAPTAPPTGGMHDLLSLLNIFSDPEPEPIQKLAPPPKTYMPTTMNSTVLKPVAMTFTTEKPAVLAPQQPEPRISNKGDTISSLLPDDDKNNEEEVEFEENTTKSKFLTTDEPPRGTRQVFDYDQLPESRLKEFIIDNFSGGATGDDNSHNHDDDDDDDAAYDDEEHSTKENNHNADDNDSDEADSSHKFLKRIDSFLDDDDVGEVDDDSAEVTLDDLEGSNEFEELSDLATDMEDVSGT